MENHPIPQDVTGFQFKLVGNMTIKQFAYLATGVVLAWVMYATPLNGFIRLPFVLFFGFSGFCLAFIPIDGRPLDAMLLYFIRALFTPNQYVFEKGITTASVLPIPTSINTPPPQPFPAQKQETIVRNPKPTEQPTTLAQPPTQTKNLEYEQLVAQFTQTQAENKRLEGELTLLKRMLAQTQQQTPIQRDQKQPPAPQPHPPPTTTTPPPPVAKPMIRKATAAPLSKMTGLPTPELPNILMGIVRDPRGNMLANILVEVKDKDGSPVRAFKTNGLGQFASATPLPNGVYTLEFEDPQKKQRFDSLELTMNGEIIGPIEATSVDEREDLRKSLFPNA